MLTKPLRELKFTVFDTETTGLSPKSARLVEIASVKVEEDFTINHADYFSQLINPLCRIGYDSYKIHKISNDMVADKPTIDKVLPSFAGVISDTVLVAHNAKFDMSFLDAASENAGLKLTHLAVLDTVILARKAFPKLKSYNLDTMIDYLGISVTIQGNGRHRALFDALNTAELFIKCLEALEKKGVKYICDL